MNTETLLKLNLKKFSIYRWFYMLKLNTIDYFKNVSDRYYASKDGFIYYLNTNKEFKKIKIAITKNGYCTVNLLLNNGNNKRYYLHRIIAIVFIPNPCNKPQVNHIDENKQNNASDNLEWVIAKENMNHGTVLARIKNTKMNKKNTDCIKNKFVKCESSTLYLFLYYISQYD